jgi:hypothetical protein
MRYLVITVLWSHINRDFYRVYQGFGLDIDERSETTTFVSFLTTFEASIIFGAVVKIRTCLKSNY